MKSSSTPHSKDRMGPRALLSALVVVAVVFVGSSATAAQTAGADTSDLADVDVVRHGGADRYATSLMIAEAFAADAGGKLDDVVLVSGEHWYDAAIAVVVAANFEAPVLMTPSDGMREDALEFLERVGTDDVEVTVVSSGTWPDTTISPQVFVDLADAGFSRSLIRGKDRYLTSVKVARWFLQPGSLSPAGASAIIANGTVFADALVAGPLSSKAQVPMLLTPQSELHAEVAAYLSDAHIKHVVLMGGTAALSQAVEDAIEDLGIVVDRMAGESRFETATMTAHYAQDKAAGTCFDGSRVGLAGAEVPFDSFSSAPLLARYCAALVLTDPAAVPQSTADYLDGVRRSIAAGPVGITVFGGNAAVSQAAIDAYLGVDDSAS